MKCSWILSQLVVNVIPTLRAAEIPRARERCEDNWTSSCVCRLLWTWTSIPGYLNHSELNSTSRWVSTALVARRGTFLTCSWLVYWSVTLGRDRIGKPLRHTQPWRGPLCGGPRVTFVLRINWPTRFSHQLLGCPGWWLTSGRWSCYVHFGPDVSDPNQFFADVLCPYIHCVT